jgi:hypothetical protein
MLPGRFIARGILGLDGQQAATPQCFAKATKLGAKFV